MSELWDEARALLASMKAAMSPTELARHEEAVAVEMDWLLYGEVFYDTGTGKRVPHEEARPS